MLCKVNEDGSLSEVASNGGGLINDEKTSENETWSSKKINDSLADKSETVSFFTIDELKDFIRKHHESKVYLFKTPVGAGYLSGFITKGRTNASTAGIMSIKGNDVDGWFADFHIYDGYLNAFVSRYSENDDEITKCNELQNGNYSTDTEIVVGTINVDGVEKKVYRKSFTKSMSANGTWQAEIGATLASVVNFYGTFKKDTANWSQHIPYYHTDGAGSYSIYCYVNENGNVQCTGYSTTDGQYFKGKYLLHVEYTKVND